MTVRTIGAPLCKKSPTARIPSYRLHKSSGRAVVTLAGRDIFLGKHGTPENTTVPCWSVTANAYAMAWRSDVQANDLLAASLTTTSSSATWSSGSTSLFSAEQVSGSSDSDNDRLIDLLG